LSDLLVALTSPTHLASPTALTSPTYLTF